MGIFAKSKGAGLLDDRFSIVKKIKRIFKIILWTAIIITAIVLILTNL